MVETVLQEMSPRFARRYAKVRRPSIAPERLLMALLLQIFYSVRSERLLMAWTSTAKMPPTRRVTLAGDKNYDTQDCVETLRQMRITPHVAQNDINRSSSIDGRTTRHVSYPISQRKRKRLEPSFGWMKMIGLLRKVKLRGLRKVSWWFTLVGAAYNLVRLRRLKAQAVACAGSPMATPSGSPGAAANPLASRRIHLSPLI